MTLGMLFINYKDAVQEGDGLSLWKHLLPIFCFSGRKNYSVEVLLTLYQFYYARQFLWSRFVNTRGLPSRNKATYGISCVRIVYQLTSQHPLLQEFGKALFTISPRCPVLAQSLELDIKKVSNELLTSSVLKKP